MGIERAQLQASLDAIAAIEPRVAAALARVGYPEPRLRERGYETLLRTIVGQQVSVAAATSILNKLVAGLGDLTDPETLAGASDDALRAAGLSRQKTGYARSLADAVSSGRLDLMALPADDEAAIAQLVEVKGIGRWSAEIYLLFAEGRPDIWPAGDLAVQAGLHKLLGLDARPSEKATRDMAEKWRPHRGATAIFTWHCYNNPAL